MTKKAQYTINLVILIQIKALAALVEAAQTLAASGFEDIFSSIFGGGGRRRDPNAPRQGADLQYTMTLSLKKLFSKRNNN